MILNRKLLNLILLIILFSLLTPVFNCWALHYPWDQNHDTVVLNMGNEPGPSDSPLCNPCDNNSLGSPVYISNGHFIWMDTDISFNGRPTLGVARSFNSNDPRDGSFGNGWTFNFEKSLFKVRGTSENGEENLYYILRVPNGKRYQYDIKADGTIITPPSRFDKVIPQKDGTTQLKNQNGSYEIYKDGNLIRKTDRFDNSLVFTYNPNGILSRVSDSNARFLDFAYGSNGRIGTITDHTNRTWTYMYDPNGNLTGVTNPGGGISRYEYESYQAEGDSHTYFRITKIIDETGVVVTKVTYDKGRVQSYTSGENIFTYTHNEKRKSVAKEDSLGNRRWYFYNEDGLIVEKLNPLGDSLITEYNDMGDITQITDELGKIWVSTYDESGRVLSYTNPLNHSIAFEYDKDNPNPVKIISPTGRVSEFIYDENFNLIRTKDPSGALRALEWNSSGDITAFIDPLKKRSQITYNSLGLPETVTETKDRKTLFAYDLKGNLIQITNSDGDTSKREYDDLDRVVKIINPGNQISIFSYDPSGRLISLTGPDQKTITYVYDDYGRLKESTSADGRKTVLTYRADNRIESIVKPGDILITYGYDKAGQLVSEDVNGETVSFRYTKRGQLLSASKLKNSIEFAYDDIGRMVKEKNNGKTIVSKYNDEGERILMSALKADTNYTHDHMGRIIGIGKGDKQYTFSYDIMGRRKKLTLPNGSSIDYIFDTINQLTGIQHGGTFKAGYSYEYDNNGRITKWTGNGADWQYTYDDLGRLKTYTHGKDSRQYEFDGSGNILDKNKIYDPANRLTQDETCTYTYDLRGNLTQKKDKKSGDRIEYTWSVRNQLTHINYYHHTETKPHHTLSYTYGPLGRRSSRIENGKVENFIYDGNDVIAVTKGRKRVLKSFTHGPGIDEPLSITDSNGSNYYYHANHQGSIMALTDDAGKTVNEYSYSPYGKTVSTNKNISNPFQYTGRERETDNLYYYRARYYDPDLGRFLSEDPIGLAGGDFNLYRYVGGDPVNFYDPSGLKLDLSELPSWKESATREVIDEAKKNNCLRKMINHLENSKIQYRVRLPKKGTEGSFDPKTGIIEAWVKKNWRKPKSDWQKDEKRYYPGGQLIHELYHAYEFDKGILCGSKDEQEDRAVQADNVFQKMHKIKGDTIENYGGRKVPNPNGNPFGQKCD